MRVNELTPTVTSVDEASFGDRIGLRVGDRIVSINDTEPRDILEWYRLSESGELTLEVERADALVRLNAERRTAEPLGVSVSSAVFDRVQTCDNHCEFCFIYQLPKGMRRSLYLKDDDYRLSFLFGNFTTLTRFTEADLERVMDENLSPLFVSVHATDPYVRAQMLRNERGGVSLRWLRELLDAGVEVRAQIVLCPGVNDGDILDDTLSSLLEDFPDLSSVAIVPVGLSKHNSEERMRVHSPDEAASVIRRVEGWQSIFLHTIGRRLVFAADELYLNAGLVTPPLESYEDLHMIEDGIGIASRFVEEFTSGLGSDQEMQGFFQAMDNPTEYVRAANPAGDTGLRPVSVSLSATSRSRGSEGDGRAVSSDDVLCVLTGSLAAPVLTELLEPWRDEGIIVHEVVNRHFGGNTAVAGLLTGEDIREVCAEVVTRHDAVGRKVHFLLPDVCLNGGMFLDGTMASQIQTEYSLEVIAARGHVLRRAVSRFIDNRSARNV